MIANGFKLLLASSRQRCYNLTGQEMARNICGRKQQNEAFYNSGAGRIAPTHRTGYATCDAGSVLIGPVEN
jgi:hypothetical protein